MKTKRRREVTIEIDEVVVVRRLQAVTLAWCGQCAKEVQMVTPDRAAATASTSLRRIYRRLEAGALHFTETTEGSVLICLNSLSE